MSTPTIGELERRIADLEARGEEWDEEIGMSDGESVEDDPKFIDINGHTAVKGPKQFTDDEPEPYEGNTPATIQAGEAGLDDDATLIPCEDPTRIGCGCGEYSIVVSDHQPIYSFDAICPKCGNHFGWDADPESFMEAER